MDPEEAIALLLRLAYPDLDTDRQDATKKNSAGAIAKQLGYLAIALTHAGATIRKNICTLEAYLHRYFGVRRVILRSQSPQAEEFAETIATWDLPFQRISQKNKTKHKDAVDLVHMFAFLHFESVPEQIFIQSWHGLLPNASNKDLLPGLIRSGGPCDDYYRDRFSRAIQVLHDYSLIDHDPERKTCSLHPVVHRWAQERLSPTEQIRWLNCTMTILAYCISPTLEVSGRQFRHSLLPHINACLDGFGARGIVLPETLTRAEEIERFASVYAENGRWDIAKRWQEQVLKFRARKLGWWHKDTLRAQRDLAETNWNLFDLQSVVNTQRNLLLVWYFVRPSWRSWATWPPWKPNHVDYCFALDDLSRSLWLAGDRGWSRHVGERAVRGLTEKLGPDDPRTLNATFNLARTYLHLGDPQLSHRLLVKVLVKRKRFFGMDHPDTLMTRNELGMNLCAQKSSVESTRRRQLVAAEAMVRNVLEARERILGEEHAYTLWSVNDLSKVLCEQRRGAEAVALLEKIEPTVQNTLGERHVGMTLTKTNLARAYVLCKRWEDAKDQLQAVLQRVSRDHPDEILTRSGLVHVRIRMGKLAEAEEDCSKLVAMTQEKRFSNVLAPDSPQALKIIEQMLEIYHLQGRAEELKALSMRFPAAKVPSSLDRFDMLPRRNIVRSESELDRLS